MWLLVWWAFPLMAAPDWAHWRAEFNRLHSSALPEQTIRTRFADLQSRLPADPPYDVLKELSKVRIRLADDHAQTSKEREMLRQLALRHGDQDTVYLMQVGEIFDSHSDANIEVSLRALDQLRLHARDASTEVQDAMAIAYAYMYWDVGNFELALRHMLKATALARSRQAPDVLQLVERKETLARLYVDMNDAPRAFEMLAQVGQQMPPSVSPRQRAHMQATEAAALRLSGRAQEAVDLLIPALGRLPTGDAGNASQRLRQELARSYLQMNQPLQASRVASEMIGVSASGSPYFKAEGQVLLGAAEVLLGQEDAGLANMQRGLDYFEQGAQTVALQQGLSRKVDVLAMAGRDHEALAASRKQQALVLRLYDSNRAQGVASLHVEEDIARREREIRDLSSANSLQQAMLQKERVRNVTLMLGSMFAVSVVVLLALLLHATRQQRKALWRDALTGAFNRHYLSQWLKSRRTRARGHRVVALLDLDHFKAINDHHGHAAGDEVLRRAGERLRHVIDKRGEVFRWGGEEFLLIQELPMEADVEGWLQSLLDALRPPIDYAGQVLNVSASIGCMSLPLGKESKLDAFETGSRVADVAMYQAKAEGRGRAIWLVLTDAGSATWPWTFTITAETLRDWEAKGWVDAHAVMPSPLA